MKTLHHISLIAAAVAALCAGNALAAPTVDANIEFDNTYRSGSKVDNTADEGLGQGGRVELNVSGKAGADMLVAARASLLAKTDGTAATDDMWVQLGSAKGDVKLGRFEAADLFPLAQDTLINHAGNVYYGNALRGRKDANVF
ncbi:MAG: carbohydrate porin, partial [Polaromonas sp.]|nr:carbohydrate porin [Polaromonas sp.]